MRAILSVLIPPKTCWIRPADPRLHMPLQAVIRFGKGGERNVPVTLGARLSEVGTLETWAESKISDHRWRLQFQLRKTADAPKRLPLQPSPAVRSTRRS